MARLSCFSWFLGLNINNSTLAKEREEPAQPDHKRHREEGNFQLGQPGEERKGIVWQGAMKHPVEAVLGESDLVENALKQSERSLFHGKGMAANDMKAASSEQAAQGRWTIVVKMSGKIKVKPPSAGKSGLDTFNIRHAKEQSAPRGENPKNLAYDLLRVRQMLKNMPHKNKIEESVRKMTIEKALSENASLRH